MPKDFKPISNLMVVNKERDYLSGCRYIIARKFEEDGIWKVLVLDYLRNTSYTCTIPELKKLGKTNILNADFIKGDRIRTKAHYMHIKTGKLNIVSSLIQDFRLILEILKEEDKAKKKAEREKKKLELEKKSRKQQAHEEMLLEINNIVQTAEYQGFKSFMVNEVYLITFSTQVQDKIEKIKVNIGTLKNNYIAKDIDLSTYLRKLNRKKKHYINKAKSIIMKALKEKLSSSVWDVFLTQGNEVKKFIENLPKNEYRSIYVKKLVKPITKYLMQLAKEYYTTEKVETYLKDNNTNYNNLLVELENTNQKINADKLEVRKKIPTQYKDNFQGARQMKRHFIIHVGQTNSGKTFEALQDFLKAQTGIYLAPLRLLAYEIYESTNKQGVPCNMVTGEEIINVPNALHQASTIEMLDTNVKYNVAIIDETQMLSDKDRGGFWTRAIVGVQAERIHICTAPQSLKLLKQLLTYCEDTFEIKEHNRLTPLNQDTKAFRFPKDVQKHDALIVFSKKNVITCSAELQRI